MLSKQSCGCAQTDMLLKAVLKQTCFFKLYSNRHAFQNRTHPACFPNKAVAVPKQTCFPKLYPPDMLSKQSCSRTQTDMLSKTVPTRHALQTKLWPYPNRHAFQSCTHPACFPNKAVAVPKQTCFPKLYPPDMLSKESCSGTRTDTLSNAVLTRHAFQTKL